jgi:hypothetical protein
MDDAADDPTIINPLSTGLILRKVLLDGSPSLIIKPENLTHPQPPRHQTIPWNHIVY